MTSVSTMGQANDQITRLKTIQTQLATLQNQVATGKKTQVFKGLGTDVIMSKRARADFKMIENFSRNITIGERRLKLMQNNLTEIKEQAGHLLNALEIQTQKGEFEMKSVGDLAGKIRDFMVDLLNERDGQRYLFGGAETLSPPLSDTGTLDTYVQTKINAWINTSIDTDELISSYRDRGQLNDTIMGYSPSLSSGQTRGVSIRVEQHTEIDYTVFANDSSFRDILAAATMIKKISETMDEVTLDADDPAGTVTAPGATAKEQSDNFYKMFNDVATMINAALKDMEQVQYRLSQIEAQTHQIRENHKLEKSILLDNISDVENIDLNETAVKLSALQIQLEASFQVTASVRALRLANFL